MGFQDSSWNIFHDYFDDPSCIGFRDIVWKNRQTNSGEYPPPPATAVDAGNDWK